MSEFTLIAGPCTVEARRQTLVTADCVAAAGATMLRSSPTFASWAPSWRWPT